MKLKEISPGQGEIEVEAAVVEVGEPREINKFGNVLRVATAKIEDDSGKCDLTLWNDDVGKLKVGDKIKISKGYAKEFNGAIQLTTGKFGTLEVLNGDGASSGDAGSSESAAGSEAPASSGDEMSEEGALM